FVASVSTFALPKSPEASSVLVTGDRLRGAKSAYTLLSGRCKWKGKGFRGSEGDSSFLTTASSFTARHLFIRISLLTTTLSSVNRPLLVIRPLLCHPPSPLSSALSFVIRPLLCHPPSPCHPVDKPKGVVKGEGMRRVAVSNSLAMSLETWCQREPSQWESFSV